MNGREFFADQRSIETPSGVINYVERGRGRVALFVHGVLLNSYLWRHQLAELGDLRRCIALDLMAHGNTEISVGQDVSVTANAHMLAQFLDALKIDEADLVGNDSGGGICQIFAALYPKRVRSLVLTNCDAHDNWPPKAFKGFVDMVAGGGLAGTLAAMLADKAVYRSPQALALAYEHPETVSDETIEVYLRPHLRSAQRTHDLERFVNAFDCRHTVDIEVPLGLVQAPTLIAWGTDDVFFDLKWSHWLEKAIPGTTKRVEFKGARIFFPEERSGEFNKEVTAHWVSASVRRSKLEASS
jgi:pimeloyl-ACP methyl ester carboxylesterase